MSRILALEWDDHEARLAVAGSRAGLPRIEQAFSVSRQLRLPGADRAKVNVGQRISAALAARGIGRVDTLVALGRSNIELRQLSLPPAPDDELPELVRFQALKEFNALEEDWPLDFIPLDDAADQPRNVLAAAIAPEVVAQIEETCHAAGLKPRRLVLRPCAAAALLRRRRRGGRRGVQLLIDVLADEADLTVMIEERVIFLRTARLPGDLLENVEHLPALLAEIRRTMAASQNQLSGRRVESIVLCGSGTKHEAFAKLIEQHVDAPVELFDPFGKLTLGRELRSALPDHPGRFAPLLGMLLDELQQTPPVVDFLHPHRRPPKPSRRRWYLLAATAAVLLAAVFFANRQLQRSRLSDEIEYLQASSEALDELLARTDAIGQSLDTVEQFTDGRVMWLDELRRLSEKFPPADQAVLTRLICSVNPRTGAIVGRARAKGEMKMEGSAKSLETINAMEQGLRDLGHPIKGKNYREDGSNKPYAWQFGSSLYVAREQQP